MSVLKNNLTAILAATAGLMIVSTAMATGGNVRKAPKGTAPGVTNAINNVNKRGLKNTTTVLGNTTSTQSTGLANSINTINRFGLKNIGTVYGPIGKSAPTNPTNPCPNPTNPCPNPTGYCGDGHRNGYYSMPVCVSEMGVEPSATAYVVVAGDTLQSISMNVYGTVADSTYIATFNKLPENVALVPGQTLMLPAISTDNVPSPSLAPVATSQPVAMN